jgi:hydroxyacylglutathione hydrolase
MSTTTVTAIRAFTDNYIWCIRRNRHAAVVDPGDAEPVLSYLRAENLELTAILNTHHHSDHVGGNALLLSKYSVPVFGPAGERIPGVTVALREGDRIVVPGVELKLSVLDIPGHTRGHIAFFGDGLLFCGDTLFSCGCGRLFEGTPDQMHASLSKLASLPDDTRVYCGHEYTLSNIRFARAADGANPALAALEASARAALERGEPSLPSTIRVEKAANPFLRSHVPELVEAASRYAGQKLDDPVEVFAALRQWKNGFRS